MSLFLGDTGGAAVPQPNLPSPPVYPSRRRWRRTPAKLVQLTAAAGTLLVVVLLDVTRTLQRDRINQARFTRKYVYSDVHMLLGCKSIKLPVWLVEASFAHIV